MSRNADFAMLEDDQRWMYQSGTEHEGVRSARVSRCCDGDDCGLSSHVQGSVLHAAQFETKEEMDARRAALATHKF